MIIPSTSPASSDAPLLLLAYVSNPFPPRDAEVLRRAYDLAESLYKGRFDLTNTPRLQHAMGSAAILTSMNMDHESIAAMILHAVPEYLDDWQDRIETAFGENVRILVEGVSRMEQIEQFSDINTEGKKKQEAAKQIEGLRKMLLAMVADIRIVLIKLADRTQTMRRLYGATPEQQIVIAQRTRNIFAPLANRLGIWQLKWELEDLSVRYLEPDLYKRIAKLLDERRADREQYIASVVLQLKQQLDEAGIRAEVTGRPKHIYSIVNKMKRKQIEFSELYDVRAVRILIDDRGIDGIRACYTALGLVHELWTPIESEFDDYIAHPKSNNYRSLHTAVVGPRSLPLEVQIRTREMHEHSELGIAAHWRYKEGVKSDAAFDERIAVLRQLLEWKEDLADKSDLSELFKNKLFHDQVYVFTPLGKVIALPKGATPVEFAYTLHTNLGHRTRGAKVDGNIVPLSYKLQNGQRVEILTVKEGGPSRDWINPALGFLQSSRMRAKVRAWFKAQNLTESIAQGRVQLDRELHRFGITSINQERLAQRLHFHTLEEFLAAVGRNEVTHRKIAVAIKEESPGNAIEIPKPNLARPQVKRAARADIIVGGVNNLMTRLAKCCNPAPPDQIVGYVTRDRGIAIHREDCRFMVHLAKDRLNRKLTAQWRE
jgi:GTP pyrophosphokinase